MTFEMLCLIKTLYKSVLFFFFPRIAAISLFLGCKEPDGRYKFLHVRLSRASFQENNTGLILVNLCL